mgnify:CR=1 FL=1
MTIYDRILVPTDSSPEGRRAVAHAVDLAEVHDAMISGLYVINTASYNGLPMEAAWEGVTTLLNTDGHESLEVVEAMATDRGVPVATEIVEGSPTKAIIKAADRNHCDLIVMGTHGRGGLDRLLLGSVAEKVVRRAEIPVTTVRIDESMADMETAQPEADTPMPADSST